MGDKKFSLLYINGRWIIPVLLLVFLYGYKGRIEAAITNIGHESHQEILFLVFLLAALGITSVTFLRKLSLIPVLGMLFCLYLMIEIPARSWLVFFGWMALGLTIYFSYGYRKSKLAGGD